MLRDGDLSQLRLYGLELVGTYCLFQLKKKSVPFMVTSNKHSIRYWRVLYIAAVGQWLCVAHRLIKTSNTTRDFGAFLFYMFLSLPTNKIWRESRNKKRDFRSESLNLTSATAPFKFLQRHFLLISNQISKIHPPKCVYIFFNSL